MADNTYINKVEYEGQTLMDLTGDTATPSDVLSGVSFHDRSGAAQTGSLITHNVYDGLDSSSTSDALSANQGKILNNALETKMNCVRQKLSNGAAWTYTFPSTNMTFMVFVTRYNVTSTTAEGVFVGATGTANGHITAIGTAPSNLNVSMNADILSMTASTTNMVVTIMYAN